MAMLRFVLSFKFCADLVFFFVCFLQGQENETFIFNTASVICCCRKKNKQQGLKKGIFVLWPEYLFVMFLSDRRHRFGVRGKQLFEATSVFCIKVFWKHDYDKTVVWAGAFSPPKFLSHSPHFPQIQITGIFDFII